MTTTKTKPAAKRTPPKTGSSALDGLEVSLAGAQAALGELKRDLGAGGRHLVKDVENAVKAARRDLGRTRKAIQADLSDLGGALTPHHKPAKPAARKRASSAARR